MSVRPIPAQPADSSELPSGANTRISGPWLLAARITLITLSVFVLILYVAGTPVYFAWFNSLHTPVCLDVCLTPANIQSLHALGIPITTFAVYWVTLDLLFALTYFVVATLIFWRKSDDWIALFASFSLVAFGASFTAIPNTLIAVHPAWWLPVTLVSENVLGFPSLIVFFFLFPTGRFVPRWTRWMAAGVAPLFALSAFFPDSHFNISNWPAPLPFLGPLLVFGSLVFAQVYRYRHISTPIERQQTKWVVFGAVIALLGLLLLGSLLTAVLRLFIPLQSLGLLPSVILVTSIYLLLLLIPLSLAIAILRYRLWDVDALINRTLVYGMLTLILTAIYVGLIIGLQALLHGIISQDNSVAVVISTLAIAALFQPLRHRIQKIIDRRFYRSKYDAAKIIEAFSTTLRNEVDLDQLRGQLVAVVEETMHPAHVSLWLPKPKQPEKDTAQFWVSDSLAPIQNE